jgi:Zn-dependent protease
MLDSFLQGILGRLVLFIPVLLLSLTVHEFAHAWSANRLGDDTARRMGRLTLNPLAHADPIGTFILPLLNVPFGWARPVPVDPSRFRRDVHMGRGMMVTALAGPLSNLVLAVVSAVLLGLVARMSPGAGGTGHGAASAAVAFLFSMIQMNVVLAVFNLLPVPPLDGSRIVDAFLPYRFRPAWESFSRYSMILLLVIVFLGWRLIAVPVTHAIDLLVRLASLIA